MFSLKINRNFIALKNDKDTILLIYLNIFTMMAISNFWFYTIMGIVILHILVGFVYILYKLSPKKKNKHKNE